jgi:hypothetical protein
MSREYEIKFACFQRNIPQDITTAIIYGYLNNNILGLLFKTDLQILQNAVVMENSSRRITDSSVFLAMNKMQLIHAILDKIGGLKRITGYIKKTQLNIIQVNTMKVRNLFSLNDGFIHKYYLITSITDDKISCHETSQFNEKPFIHNSNIQAHILSDIIQVIPKSKLKTAILLNICHSIQIDIYDENDKHVPTYLLEDIKFID